MSRTANQKQKIEEYMLKNGSITPSEAYLYCGCMKASTRIGEMIREGKQIEKEMVYTRDDDGNPMHYMKYRMAV